jgi:hypothetical protein
VDKVKEAFDSRGGARSEDADVKKNPLISTSEDPAKSSGLYTQLDLASGMRNGSCFD